MEEAPERSMVEDLRRMLEDESFSDMVFLCGDAAEEVPASRMLVVARSPVLEAMLLKAGMRESTLACIDLPDIDAQTMRICLEFFYTDTVKPSSSSPQNETFMKVISAARFLLIPRLEHIALSYLASYVENFWAVRTSTHLLLDTAKAYTHGVDLLLSHPHDDIHLQKVLWDMANSVEFCTGWTLQAHKHLSRQALAHLLQNLYVPSLYLPTLWEYFLFVKVVEWCASRLVLHADDPIAEEEHFQYAIDEFLPRPERFNMRHIFYASDKPLDVQSLRVFKLLREPLAECLEHVPVKLYKIPPLILSRNIEPLGILPSSAFFSAYRVQALSRVHLRWNEFEHHKQYDIFTDGSVTCCTSDVFAGIARCSTGIERDLIGNFEWEVVMLAACEQLRVGFCFGGSHMKFNRDESVLGDGFGSWALSSDGLLYQGHRTEPKAYCDAFPVKIGLIVGVHLNCSTFSFSVNGSKGGEIKLPNFLEDEVQEAPLYPAISMQKPGIAQIQMVVQDWMAHPPHKELLDPNGVKKDDAASIAF